MDANMNQPAWTYHAKHCLARSNQKMDSSHAQPTRKFSDIEIQAEIEKK